MSMELARAPYSPRKLTVLAAGLGLLIVAGISQSFAEGADCPAWTSPVCRARNLGPPPTCRTWGCAADKASDPIKNSANQLLISNPGLLQGDGGAPGRPSATGRPLAPATAPGGLMLK